jgi:hypothetical protein
MHPVGPNTFVIGAMKAATSSLHAALARHPRVFMSPFKEPGYFLGPTPPDAPPSLSDRYRNSLSEYLGLFAAAGDRPVRGESTTDYTKRPRFEGVAERIRQFEPGARFIYLLRDPIERTISHYWWAVSQEGETRDLLEAIRCDPFYLDVSHYAWQLEPYLACFPRECVFVDTTEAFAADPEQVLRRIFSWLGVDPHASTLPRDPRENVTPARLARTRSAVLQRLRHSRVGDALTRLTPRGVRALGRRLAEREVDRKAIPLEPVYDFLRPIQREQTRRLEVLVGRPFPEWTTLWGDRAP